ncbi:MAG: phosphatidylserine decarboxylase [Betaproteobacteria bacterium]|nr:phosphatidylserine decarboxylase [Betaproteobacteria bacterium]
MDDYPHPYIAREGWPFLLGAVLLSIAVTAFAGAGWASPFWLITVFVAQFFRDPARRVPTQPGVVISPADGRVVSVERTQDPYLNREALKISVFMNVFNVHSNRSPVEGTVRERWYNAGKFLNAALAKASVENERNALWIQTDDGADVTSVQVAGLVARRILCYVEPGAHVRRGERYGFIRFGSRLDLYLPVSARAKAVIGDTVRAGETILAELQGAA